MTENLLTPSIYLVRTDNRALLERGLVGIGWSEYHFQNVQNVHVLDLLIEKWRKKICVHK